MTIAGGEMVLRTRLRALLDAMPHLPKSTHYYRNPYDFVLREGVSYAPRARPAGVPLGLPRGCYHNSIMLSLARGLAYVEGFALTGSVQGHRWVSIPHAHAWNLDADGHVIDSTWDDRLSPPHGRAYLGVMFSARRADDCTWEGDACVLNDMNRDWPVLQRPWRGEDSPGDTDGMGQLIVERWLVDNPDTRLAPGVTLGEAAAAWVDAWRRPRLTPASAELFVKDSSRRAS